LHVRLPLRKRTLLASQWTGLLGAGQLDYSLSKRTDVYAGVDYTRLNGAWQTLAGTSGFTLPVSGRNSVFEATVGLRHKF
ncbi:porin, partial [Ralstonia pseudosolanacearum]|nr:porin [Ralstonia pseudosolanacearum]MDO3604382.1 porin [Ralstonia pseudosolanacearum]